MINKNKNEVTKYLTIKEKRHVSLEAFFRMYLNAIKSKSLFFICPILDLNIIALVRCLEKESWIGGYQLLKNNQNLSFVKIFLNYDASIKRLFGHKIRFYSMQGRKRIATVTTLQRFHNRYPYSLAILRTSYGLLTIRDCLLRKCGGEFVVSLS